MFAGAHPVKGRAMPDARVHDFVGRGWAGSVPLAATGRCGRAGGMVRPYGYERVDAYLSK